LTTVDASRHYRAEGADIEEVGAHPIGQLARLGLLPRQVRIIVRLGRLNPGLLPRFKMALVQDSPFDHVDAVANIAVMHGLDIVADLALDRDVRNQSLVGLRIEPWQVAGIGVTVRVAVGHVEEENEIVTVLQGGHRAVSSVSTASVATSASACLSALVQRWW